MKENVLKKTEQQAIHFRHQDLLVKVQSGSAFAFGHVVS